MVSSRQWSRSFTVTPEDIEYLINHLLETEMPMSTRDLALALVAHRLEEETRAFREQFEGAALYDPARRYEVGQRVIFPAQDFAIATVEGVRPGENPEYGAFDVLQVAFPDHDAPREFAAALEVPHALNAENGENVLPGSHGFSAEEVLADSEDEVVDALEARLKQNDSLIYVTRLWFPRDLILDLNEGHRHLTEAVLDMVEGGPLSTEDILDQIGEIARAPRELQVFSLNLGLSRDERFDEVGPSGEVLWYLTRMEPAEVRKTPAALRYTPIEYQFDQLTDDMQALEEEINDELSGFEPQRGISEGHVTLIYPHRRAGTLPLNASIQALFPTARRAPRIYVTLVDGQDGEEFTGWVVHTEHYVHGLANFYRKHKLPIGAQITVRKSSEPGKVIIDFGAYRARTEYVPIFGIKGDTPSFESAKRSIGANFDELMILGVEDLATVEAFAEANQRKPIAGLLRMLVPALASLTPQGTVHAKTLYSALNVLRRCPPGPMLAMLNANPDFENVGGHYWRLSER
jgi:hypothetical protein